MRYQKNVHLFSLTPSNTAAADVGCLFFVLVFALIIVLLFGLVKLKLLKDDKLVISPPINFEHTLHVHLERTTGEFIVNISERERERDLLSLRFNLLLLTIITLLALFL